MAHKQAAWNDGHDRLRVSEQYAGRPQDGINFHVEQRTTLAGRAVLLKPEHVAELVEWLSARLAEARDARPYPDGPQSRRDE